MEEQTSDFRDHHFATEIPLCDQFFNFNGDSKSYYNSYTNGYYPLDHYGHSYHAMSPPIQSPVALSATESSSERHRSTLMSLFIHSDAPANIDMLYPHSILPTDFDIDLILDEQGHTALHWAAALANIPLLTLLIQKGAQPDRLNFSGESALIRAVMVSHNHDALTFADLLNVLKDIICIPDKKNRTLLHHICLSSSVKGKNTSCSYYLQCLLDFIAKTAYEEVISSQLVHSDGQVSLSDRFTNLLNVPDFCGDTALNIAARLGNRTLFEQLIEAGADETISNFAGLKPLDFGFTSSRESRPLVSKILI
jgi:ankyrin repeat protein